MRSTSNITPTIQPSVIPTFPPQVQDLLSLKTHNVFTAIELFTPKQTGYADITGLFPFKSTCGAQYFLVLYNRDSNANLATTLKTRQAHKIKAAWNKLHNQLLQSGTDPKVYIVDNEMSGNLKHALKKANVTLQLVPPHMHRRNVAERTIRTFKNHFLACLATADSTFPIAEWDGLVDHALITLNLLCNSRLNLKLSA